MSEKKPIYQELYEQRTRERGRLSDAYLADVKRICADTTNPLDYRRLMWSTTKSAMELTGTPFDCPEPKEAEKSGA